MYKPVTSLCAPVATVASACVLPQTGATPMTTVAIAIALGMATWAVVYFMRLHLSKQQ
jgi:LPXTG-motif cell wall-anchored protein